MSVMAELKKVWKLLSESTHIPVLLAGSIATIGGEFLSPILSHHFREQGISFVGSEIKLKYPYITSRTLFFSTVQITVVCFVFATLTMAIFTREGRVTGEQHDL